MATWKPTQEELADILEKHRAWLESGYVDGARAYLARANLAGADLAGAYLADANLAGAYLAGANLAGAKSADLALSITEIVPREGSFVGWKVCKRCIGSKDPDDAPVLVKLRITEDAKRSNAFGRKCRCSRAEVLEVTRGEERLEEVPSNFDPSFVYRVGEVVEVEDFDDDRTHECAPGIHFFLTPEEALAYVV